MKKLLCLLPLSLSLAGCPMDSMLAPSAPASGTAASGTAAPMNLSTFLTRLDSARGTALTVAQKAAVGGAVQETRSLIDGGQQRFLNAVSQVSGLDSATLGAIFPQATQPVSQTDVVNRLESRIGRKLGGSEAQAAKAATILRNGSLESLKSSLATRVGKVAGVDAAFVETLFPLVGL